MCVFVCVNMRRCVCLCECEYTPVIQMQIVSFVQR